MALLPGYSPDLNPVEYLWAWLKRHALANFCPRSLAELKTTARSKLRSGQRCQSIITFQRAGLAPFLKPLAWAQTSTRSMLPRSFVATAGFWGQIGRRTPRTDSVVTDSIAEVPSCGNARRSNSRRTEAA